MAEIIHDEYDFSHWRVLGRIDYNDVVLLTEQGYRLLQKAKNKHCIIDFSDLTHFNSALLSMLLCWYRRGLSLGIGLSFKSAPALLYQMAETYGLKFLLEDN
jgi:ABC-type transporter Mla MlaB component